MTQQRLFEALDLEPVRSALKKILSDGAVAIHWHDPDAAFSDGVKELAIDGLEVICLTDHLMLDLKRRLAASREQPFLFYTSGPEPIETQDPFLDLKTYARPFRADAASLKLGELGLAERLDLVHWVEKRKKFLASSVRIAKFKPLLEPTDTQADLDRKALAVILKAATSEPREILLAMFDGLATLDAEPPCWKELLSFDLQPSFWELVGLRFGVGKDIQTFRALLLRLFATDLARAVPSPALGSSVTSLKVSSASEVAVFLSQWRDSSSRSASYARLAAEAATVLNVAQAIASAGVDSLTNAETFETVDQRILVGIREEILAGLTDSRRSELDDIIQRRLSTHWPRLSSGKTLAACYEALEEAMTLFERVAKFEQELPSITPADLPKGYIERWHLIDTAYRRFVVRAHAAADAGWDVLKTLSSKVEDAYSVGFLAKLGMRWSEALDAGLLATWKIPNVPLQREFFKRQVESLLDEGLKRVYVVISDAFRYEAAIELADRLRIFRYSPEIGPMLSTLPSMTALGMASLLPHNKLSYAPTGQVLADGQSTVGVEARQAILAPKGGIALKAEDLKSMKRDEGRALMKDARVVYIYHDIIDAIGDKAVSESGTFDAVEECLDDLAGLVKRIIDQFNGSTVIVTADHGFLYTESSPTEIDKSSLGGKIDSALTAKKRFVVGMDLPTSGPFHRAEISVTAGIEGGWQGIYPRSTQRFHLAGGAQYVHGGPLPHEVIIPLLIVKEKEGDAAKATETRAVSVVLASHATRVTTNQQSWKFIQTERVDERRYALRATVGIYDGLRPVSDVKSLVFDSESDSMADRERLVRLTLASESFSRSRTFDLVVRNADDGTEVLKQPLTLDIAFTNEF